MASGKEEEPADEIVLPGGMSEASGVDTQAQSSGGGSSSSEVSPGILQNMMTEVSLDPSNFLIMKGYQAGESHTH